MIWRIIFGVFVIVHGLVHLLFVAPVPAAEPGKAPWPFSLTKSWLTLPPETLKIMGLALLVAAVLGYIICGIGILFTSEPSGAIYWAGIVASIFSIALMSIFWSNSFLVGAGLSMAVLAWLVYQIY